MQPFEGNCEADVAPGENGLDTAVLSYQNFVKIGNRSSEIVGSL